MYLLVGEMTTLICMHAVLALFLTILHSLFPFFFLRHPIVKHFVSLTRKSVTAAWCQPVKKYPQYCQTFPCGTISLNRVPVA